MMQSILNSRKLIVENAVLMTKDITSQLPNLSKNYSKFNNYFIFSRFFKTYIEYDVIIF